MGKTIARMIVFSSFLLRISSVPPSFPCHSYINLPYSDDDHIMSLKNVEPARFLFNFIYEKYIAFPVNKIRYRMLLYAAIALLSLHFPAFENSPLSTRPQSSFSVLPAHSKSSISKYTCALNLTQNLPWNE